VTSDDRKTGINQMKALIALMLASACTTVMAEETSTANTAPLPVEPYTYSQHLDIAKVIAMSDIPSVCEVVPARMTYEDSHGQRHIMEYRVMGNGCSNN
jgi:hypothetical protein